jgi:hypothetical protein
METRVEAFMEKSTVRKAPARSIFQFLAPSLIAALLFACTPPSSPRAPGVHAFAEGGAYRFLLVTPDHVEYTYVLQTLQNNIHEPYSDGSAAGFVDLGAGRLSFIIANENTGAISFWADIDRNAAPKTIAYHDPNGGPAPAVFDILEKSGTLWVMQTPEAGRIDFAVDAGNNVLTVYFTPASEIGRVKAIQNGAIKDFYLQALDGDTLYTTWGVDNQSTNQLFGRIDGTNEFIIANRHIGFLHYRMIVDQPNMLTHFVNPANPSQSVLDSAITDYGNYYACLTPGNGTLYVGYDSGNWDLVTGAMLTGETLP